MIGAGYFDKTIRRLKGSWGLWLHHNSEIARCYRHIQGFSENVAGQLQFNPPPSLCDELKPYCTKSLLCRQYPKSEDGKEFDATPILKPMFQKQVKLQFLLLYRIASWLQFLFTKRAIYADNVLIAEPTEEFPSNILVAILNNTNYDSLDVSSVGPNIKGLQFDLESINDGMVVVMDPFCADQLKKAQKGYDLLIQDASGAAGSSNKVHHITALISNFAEQYISQEKRCILPMANTLPLYSPEKFRIALRRLDANLIKRIEHGYNDGSLVNLFNKHIDAVQSNIPASIPRNKRNTFIMLVTALRMYNEWYSQLFDSFNVYEETGVNMEQRICDWLKWQEESTSSLDEMISSEYGQILNRKIADGDFRLVFKQEVTLYDKGSHTIIVDQVKRRIYVETADSRAIALEMESINDTDSLTSALYNCEYLPHNPRNEKSVRIAAITSGGVPYPLYTHAINYTLLTPKNQQRFDLIDKEPYLFRDDEIPTEKYLPLVKTIDGRIAGKLLDFDRGTSNHYFGTGRTGSGKSWALAQILCSLFMLGHRVIVFDVSRTYTKEELMRMLPENVVNCLFRFISVGVDQEPIPIDLGSLKDCVKLPDKKRAIYKVLEAALGKTANDRVKDTKRKDALKSFLSAYLKDKTDKVDMLSMIEAAGSDNSMGAAVTDQLHPIFEKIAEIGYSDAGWGDLFADTNRILVLDLGNEIGDSSHKLLDILTASLFNWQTAHDSQFLDIVIDELAEQNLNKESPLHTIVTQGRKFHTALWGATQRYSNPNNPSVNTMKQAAIQSFCRPGTSENQIAQKLGYANAFDAGFHQFQAGDTIMQFDAFSKETGENEPITIRGKVVNFNETPLYTKFQREYCEASTECETDSSNTV